MYQPIITAALSLALGRLAGAASAEDWRSRSIYQVMTDRFARSDGSTTASCSTVLGEYCGGSWAGLTDKLDYIQGMGFDAIWISPITYQMQGNTPDGSAYHGYWQQDLYSLNSNFGTADDLKALSDALHSREMYLMVDVVVNHNGYYGDPSSVNYSMFNPFNEESQYHAYCAIDYTDTSDTTNIEQCWMGDTTVPLPDLRTEDSDVASEYQSWISGLVAEYSIDGLRLDSVMEVNTGFWSGFVNAAGTYIVGEIDNGDAGYVCGFQDYIPGVLNYATYFPLVSAFQSSSGSISALSDMIGSVQGDCSDASLVGTFSENHDQPRFASLTSDMGLAENVVTFTMLTDGIPIIYEGQEQHYNAEGGSGTPYNREAVWLSGFNTSATLYELITSLNSIRKMAISNDDSFLTDKTSTVYSDSNNLAVRKGDMVTVLTNSGSSVSPYSLTIASGYSSGTEVTELLTCDTSTVDSDGNLDVSMDAGLPRIFYPTASLSGSGLCGASSKMRFMARPKPKQKFRMAKRGAESDERFS